MEPVYAVRANAFEKETQFRLTGGGLAIARAGDQDQVIAYDEIASIQLSYTPMRFDQSRFRARLRLRGGRGKRDIFSTHFTGPAAFEDRGPAFAAFIRALVARAGGAGAQTALIAGQSHFAFWANTVFLALCFAFLIWVFVQIWPAVPDWVVVATLGSIAALMPAVVLWFRRGWPRRFTPDAIPPDVLPPG